MYRTVGVDHFRSRLGVPEAFVVIAASNLRLIKKQTVFGVNCRFYGQMQQQNSEKNIHMQMQRGVYV